MEPYTHFSRIGYHRSFPHTYMDIQGYDGHHLSVDSLNGGARQDQRIIMDHIHTYKPKKNNRMQ